MSHAFGATPPVRHCCLQGAQSTSARSYFYLLGVASVRAPAGVGEDRQYYMEGNSRRESKERGLMLSVWDDCMESLNAPIGAAGSTRYCVRACTVAMHADVGPTAGRTRTVLQSLLLLLLTNKPPFVQQLLHGRALRRMRTSEPSS